MTDKNNDSVRTDNGDKRREDTLLTTSTTSKNKKRARQRPCWRMRSRTTIKGPLWMIWVALLFAPNCLLAEDGAVRRHDNSGAGNNSEKEQQPIQEEWTLELVRSKLNGNDIFDVSNSDNGGATTATTATTTTTTTIITDIDDGRSRSDGRRCSKIDIQCRHHSEALEKNIETDTLAPTPVPTPSPTDRPVAPTTTPSLSNAPSLVPSVSLIPSQGPSRSPTSSPTATPSSVPTWSPSANPTAVPSRSPTQVCSVRDSSTGIFGESTGANNTAVVDYFYEIEISRNATTVLPTDSEQIENDILPMIGVLAADTILPRLFAQDCAPFQPSTTDQRQRRRRLTKAVGVSADPPDLIVSGVGCADSQVDTTQNVCYVVTGATTLYYPFDTQSIESILANTTEGITDEEFTQAQENNAVLITTRSQARVAIREAINSGFYTTADPSIAAVHYRSTLPPPVTETRDGDAGGNLPWWVWVLIVVAIVLFNLCLLIGWVLYRQRQQGQIGIDDGDESNKYFNSEQPFNDLEDQSEPNEDDIMDINTQQPSLDQQRQDLFGRQGATGQQQQGSMSSSSESVSGSESESDDSEGSSVDTNELLESSDSDESSSSGEARPQGGGGRKR